MSFTAWVFAVLLASTLPPQGATSPAGDEPSPQKVNGASSLDPDELPVSIEKIQRKLAREPAIDLKEPTLSSDSGLPVFRMRIEADKITIENLLGPDYLRGPVARAGMTHQEFLNMVTPRDVQGYAGFSNREALTVAATSFALQWAVKTALHRLQEARDERAREAARREVREALEELRRARLAAGLPDR